MTLRFGTDGVRGVANRELGPELALALGRAAVRVLGAGTWAIGRDPRRSGDLMAAALTAGLTSEGADVLDLGTVPTPAVAHVSAIRRIGAAMISASHNPYGDNGIKLFAPGGMKLDDASQDAIEAELDRLRDPSAHLGERETARPVDADIGVLVTDDGALGTYRQLLTETALEGRRLDGIRIVLDTANGAASHIAPPIFEELGATVTTINDRPDGVNINHRCGSTDPTGLARTVRSTRADLGLAFDGDADRVIAVDHEGRIVDGDQILAMSAIDLHARNRLRGDTVVVTVMTNLGFRQSMAERGITVLETPVGDRHVLEALDAGGHVLGGEQSGHLIFRDLATTGDGILSGLRVADLVARHGRTLATLADEAMVKLPQVLLNVRLEDHDPGIVDDLAPQIRAAEEQLGDRGRVLIRASGTEPLIRVMVEAPTDDEARTVAEALADAVRRGG